MASLNPAQALLTSSKPRNVLGGGLAVVVLVLALTLLNPGNSKPYHQVTTPTGLSEVIHEDKTFTVGEDYTLCFVKRGLYFVIQGKPQDCPKEFPERSANDKRFVEKKDIWKYTFEQTLENFTKFLASAVAP